MVLGYGDWVVTRLSVDKSISVLFSLLVDIIR
jgi:hypothetical protein